uniref:Putative HNH endonuclease n=1 Tax=viral metagenome TaxID=1070528 RepID=A0A6M3IUD7_9ZZZZ
MGRPRIHPKEFYCLECNKIILNEHGFSIIKFCSKKCRGKYWSKNFRTELVSNALKHLVGWNRGLKVSGMSGKHQSERQKEVMRKFNKENNPSKLPEVKEKMRLAKIGRTRPDLQGINHPNWKGTSPLIKLIKGTLEYKQWRKNIFVRDNYTCQECFKRGFELHPHHLKSFSKLLKEFISLYPQFSPFEDTNILVRLAERYEPFWDITNGKALCSDCHKKTKNYGVMANV